MSDELHDTHRWGERLLREGTEERMIPCCLDCGVDGFENEPDAFLPCRPKNRCGVTMESWDNPGHTHVCGTAHATGDHHCADTRCSRWFGVR